MAKDTYELSIWSGITADETKLAVIGGNDMTSPMRAFSPKLVPNINGTNTLTFTMYRKFIDPATGTESDNLFIPYLINERKVKLKLNGEWFDFVIKKCEENSDKTAYNYTCKDIFINELSKNGYSQIYDTTLGNNYDTAANFVTKVLDGSEWQYDNTNSDTIRRYVDEPVYAVTLTGSVDLTPDAGGSVVTVAAGQVIYIFRSVVTSRETYVQVGYNSNNTYSVDDTTMVAEADSFSCTGSWVTEEDSSGTITGATLTIGNASYYFNYTTTCTYSAFRMRRYIRAPITKLNTVLNMTVTQYLYNNETIYGYEGHNVAYLTLVKELLVNNSDFSSTEGWYRSASTSTLGWRIYPLLYSSGASSETWSDYNPVSYLEVGPGNVSTAQYCNIGITQCASYLPDGFQKDVKYLLRLRMFAENSEGAPQSTPLAFSSSPNVYNYTFDSDGNIQIDTDDPTAYFSVGAATTVTDASNVSWKQYEFTCSRSISKNDILAGKLGLFFTIDGTYLIEEMQFFKYEVVVASDQTETIVTPYELADGYGKVEKTYYYYKESDNEGVTEAEDYVYLHIGNAPLTGATVVYNANYLGYGTISVKESNRFNILQSIAETFKCWIEFHIDHESNGAVKMVSGVPQKFVRLKENIGEFTGITFRYGQDLKTIKRTIDSESLATKVIVAQNENDAAVDGACSIDRASENYCKASFIYNFDYYIQQGLVTDSTFQTDYNTVCKAMHDNYSKSQELTNELTLRNVELTKNEALLTTYDALIKSIVSRRDSVEQKILNDTQETSLTNVITVIRNNASLKTDTLSSLIYDYHRLVDELTDAQDYYDQLEENIALIKARIEAINLLIYNETPTSEYPKGYNVVAEEAITAFEKTYCNIIQEGTWNSKDYVDDNLYYLAAESAAYTSSRPKVTYDINVLRLCALEEYKFKQFNIGDIGYVEDSRLFGSTKEKVTITEITLNLDAPWNDSVKVTNYRTQFEDLFQRIAATTQSITLKEGIYNRAANSFDSTGITSDSLNATLKENESISSSKLNSMIVEDGNGFIFSTLYSSANKVRMGADGISTTTDGGDTWTSLVDADGIDVSKIKAGTIDTSVLNIRSGDNLKFVWDSNGITAYKDGTSGSASTNFQTYVRFDQYGIYGIRNNSAFKPTQNTTTGYSYTDSIEDNAKFGLLWDRFFLKGSSSGTFSIKETTTDSGSYLQLSLTGQNGSSFNLSDGGGISLSVVASSGASPYFSVNAGNSTPSVTIGKWNVNDECLKYDWTTSSPTTYHRLLMAPNGTSQSYRIPTIDTAYRNDWVFISGATNTSSASATQWDANFGVTKDGILYAQGAKFAGTIQASTIMADTILGADMDDDDGYLQLGQCAGYGGDNPICCWISGYSDYQQSTTLNIPYYSDWSIGGETYDNATSISSELFISEISSTPRLGTLSMKMTGMPLAAWSSKTYGLEFVLTRTTGSTSSTAKSYIYRIATDGNIYRSITNSAGTVTNQRLDATWTTVTL